MLAMPGLEALVFTGVIYVRYVPHVLTEILVDEDLTQPHSFVHMPNLKRLLVQTFSVDGAFLEALASAFMPRAAAGLKLEEVIVKGDTRPEGTRAVATGLATLRDVVSGRVSYVPSDVHQEGWMTDMHDGYDDYPSE